MQRFLGSRLGEFQGEDGSGYETYAVFRTSKGRYAVHHETTESYKPTGPNAERTQKRNAGWRGWIGDWSCDQAWLKTPAKATLRVVDTVEELKGLLPKDLYELVVNTVAEDLVVEDIDI